MRIVSLHPAATAIVRALGLDDELAGVTDACDQPADLPAVPVVARHLAASGHGPADGGALAAPALELDEGALAAAGPDLVLTLACCPAGAAGRRRADEVVRRLDPDTGLVHLEPASLEGVLNAIQAVGAMTEAEDEAMELVEQLRGRLRRVEERVLARREAGRPPRRVVALEGLEPPAACGHWVPGQVRLAGGWELLGAEGAHPAPVAWDAVREVDPEVLLLMPAGADLAAVLAAWERTPLPAWWAELAAVRAGEVHALDAAASFSQPGPGLVDGVEVLAAVLDPDGFPGLDPSAAARRLA